MLVAVASAVGGLAGWGVLAILERFTTNPRRAWVIVASIALLASLSAPLSGTGVTAGGRIAMIGISNCTRASFAGTRPYGCTPRGRLAM